MALLMESSMINSFSNTNNEIVKNYFNTNKSSFKVILEINYGPYWGVRLTNGEIEIHISGDIGFEIEIFINNSKYSLWQYDRSVNNAMKTSDDNIHYQLNILNNFLSDSDKKSN